MLMQKREGLTEFPLIVESLIYILQLVKYFVDCFCWEQIHFPHSPLIYPRLKFQSESKTHTWATRNEGSIVNNSQDIHNNYKET